MQKNLVYDQDRQLNSSLDYSLVMDTVVDVEEVEMDDDVDDEDEQMDQNEIDHFDDDENVEYVLDSMVELKSVQ